MENLKKSGLRCFGSLFFFALGAVYHNVMENPCIKDKRIRKQSESNWWCENLGYIIALQLGKETQDVEFKKSVNFIVDFAPFIPLNSLNKIK